jgi:hypothetical protein
MSRLSLLVLPLFATPALAHEGLHHHPHGVEFGWLFAVVIGSILCGGAILAVRRRK